MSELALRLVLAWRLVSELARRLVLALVLELVHEEGSKRQNQTLLELVVAEPEQDQDQMPPQVMITPLDDLDLAP